MAKRPPAPEEPHWEHGYRCHGYWLGNLRLGRVSLPPRPVTDYGWEVEIPLARVTLRREGRCRSLRTGKRIVERLVKSVREGEYDGRQNSPEAKPGRQGSSPG